MTKTYPLADPIWCAGCGHFGVVSALDASLTRLNIPRHNAMVLAGIGCAGTIQNYVEAYGYHALHGRVLPTAAGAKISNPELTVIAAGGDGDGLAIGGGHLLHTFRNNPNIVYLLMNNATYGLTKGQASPSSQGGFRGAEADLQLDAVMLGLSLPGTTFLARSYSGSADQLERLTDAAINHANAGRGFAFLEIISPCVAYNDRYEEWPSHLIDLDADDTYDPHDRANAFRTGLQLAQDDCVPTGMIFIDESDRGANGAESAAAPAQQNIDPTHNREAYAEAMRSFMS